MEKFILFGNRTAGASAATLLAVLALSALCGCGKKAPENYISGNFVPAGMQQRDGAVGGPRDPRGMSKGDPSVPASIKSHVIPGLPGSPPVQAAPGAHP